MATKRNATTITQQTSTTEQQTDSSTEMTRYAVVIDDYVVNIVVCKSEQAVELAQALSAELIEADPLNLSIGDHRKKDGTWTHV